MSNPAWFYASEGQQHGPYPEIQLRELIAAGTVTADMLVWTEGMVNWQKAGEIPGLLSGAAGPPALPATGAALTTGNSAVALSADFGIWALLWRSLVFSIGIMLVVPAPWAATGFYRWFIRHLRAPQQLRLGFTGEPGDIWYVFVIQGLCAYAGFSDDWYPTLIVIPLEGFLSWMVVRWIIANISSEGRRLPFSFAGSPWTYVGWYLLLYISAVTIIGWAWVMAAWIRWICRHIAGTRREVAFIASGWQILWRTTAFVLAAIFIIPIPWVLGWYVRWYISQLVLLERAPARA
jgi:uncharacterized protein DUF4339